MTASARRFSRRLFLQAPPSQERGLRCALPAKQGGFDGAWIVRGIVTHRRYRPRAHAFRYNIEMLAVDVDALTELDRSLPCFGYDRWNLIHIKSTDYLDPHDGSSLREKVAKALAQRGMPSDFFRCILITSPRVLGYVFNPVSFFLCLNRDGGIVGAVAHVNNTFGDAHLYVLSDVCKVPGAFDVSYRVPKTFHVSPFFKIEGEYEFQLTWRERRVHIHMNYNQGANQVFEADLKADLHPVGRFSIVQHAMKAPARGMLTMPRILIQAARLHYQKRLSVYERPAPSHPDTVVVRGPSLYERFAMGAVCKLLQRIRYGTLVLALPNGKEVCFTGSRAQEPQVKLQVRDYDLFARLLRDSDIGAAESFIRGGWEADSVTRVLELGSRNWEIMPRRRIGLLGISALRDLLRHRLRKNTRAGSQKNIRDHYDLGDDLFRLFLDPSMTYSGAYFPEPHTSLYEAQRAKLARLARLASVRPGDHVLEVGCGWGSFAQYAAEELGCRVTCVTVSQRQYEFVKRLVQEKGLSDRIDLRLQDYRDISGSFDKIVSIEMIEAVGEEYLPSFFATMNRLLKPDGYLALQAITIPEQRRELYSKGCDFIQKHIFPGSYVPSLEQLLSIAGRSTEFSLQFCENIAGHYAETLRRWRESFMARREEVLALGYDQEFVRKWEFYFAYCEVGFATNALGLHQIVLQRSQVGRTT
ncbi:MAG: DUF1365 family protein [Bdellovibrionota bacterium]|nr:MAG: DUF1365 family protein [Bdellovibrionota bacterium]